MPPLRRSVRSLAASVLPINLKLMKRISILIMAALLLAACQKEFLETKPDKSLLVPTTLADCRALLDNNQLFNRAPGITVIADGDFTTTDAGWQQFSQLQERNSYLWEKDIYGNEAGVEWTFGYQQILYANVVLETLEKLPPGAERDELEGMARFFRAWSYYGLVQLYGKPFDPSTAAADLGLPIRRVPDVKRLEPRSSLADTYAEIFRDLSRARDLLPATATYLTRPGRTAVFAFYANLHLARKEYAQARLYADSALQRQPALLDYNSLNPALTRAFPIALANANPEVIWYASANAFSVTSSSAAFYAEPALYDSYATGDLRKSLFWQNAGTGKYSYRGQYTGGLVWFAGLATDELYFTRAECAARAGETAAALNDLNSVLAKRWKTGMFVLVSAPEAASALKTILEERRKELVGRCSRWTDLRRLNTEPALAVTLTRQLNGQAYTLAPGSPRYTYPIPPDELTFNPLVQNER
jgi:hypothetical protein